MATTSNNNIVLDFGAEGVEPIGIGGSRPATGLFGVKITSDVTQALWPNTKGPCLSVGWEVVEDPMAMGSVGRGEDEHKQALPTAKQEDKDRGTTLQFLSRFVQGVTGRVIALKGKGDLGKLLAAMNKLSRDASINGGIRYLHYTEFIEGEQDSKVTWLSAAEYAEALTAFKTSGADVLYRKPGKGKGKGKGKGGKGTDLGSPDIGADIPDAGDLSAGSANGKGGAQGATETVDDVFNLGV